MKYQNNQKLQLDMSSLRVGKQINELVNTFKPSINISQRVIKVEKLGKLSIDESLTSILGESNDTIKDVSNNRYEADWSLYQEALFHIVEYALKHRNNVEQDQNSISITPILKEV